jgi:uncharacterized membrane protein YgdD (TMEM256/DUF423 family)
LIIKKLLILGSVLGGIGVLIGAFGAHGLENKLNPDQLQTFETGVRYQFYHAFLALVAGLVPSLSRKKVNLIFYCILAGVILFSGSIYGLATNALTGFDFSQIALLTPVGGLFLIAAWIILLLGIIKLKTKKTT